MVALSRNLALRCIAEWGIPSQLFKILEELNELSELVIHFALGRITGTSASVDIAMEIADVQVVMEELQVIIGLEDGITDKEIEDLILSTKRLALVELESMLENLVW